MLSRSLRQYRISVPYEGMIFLGGMTLIVLIAMAYANNLAFVFVFLLIGLVLVSLVQCLQKISELRLTQIHPLPTFAGDEGVVELYLRNPSGDAILGLEARLDLGVGWEKKFRNERSPILSGQSSGVVLARFNPRKRGRFWVRRVAVSSTFPFGILRVTKIFPAEKELYVYPELSGLQTWPESGGMFAGEGEVGLGSGEDFSGHKEYREGASQRRIDWKLYARTDQLYTKEFTGGAEEAIIFDWRSVMTLDEDRVASQLGKWLQLAHDRRIRFGLQLPEMYVDIDIGKIHYHRCMSQLALLRIVR